MKIIITKQQYKKLVYSLLDTIVGGELTVQKRSGHNYTSVYDSEGENIMNIFSKKGSGRNKGCKSDLGLDNDFLIELQKYVPYFKNKIFSEVLVDYVYEKTGIKCDCVDYSTDYKVVDNNGTEFGYFDSRFAYNVKKKKKIRFDESVENRQSLDEIIYNFLEDEYYPDYNWGPELFDFYKNDVKNHGSVSFYINDDEGYTYYDDGTLEIMPFVSERLDEWFNDSWLHIFTKWFEEHSGLKVKRVVTMDGVVKLNESMDKNKKLLKDIVGFDFSDRIQQITSTYDVPMEFDEGIGPSTIKMYLNHWGPMYLFKLDDMKYLYQDRGSFEMFIDEEGFDYVDNEIPEKLGIAVLGLRFSDIIDIYFKEEE